MSVAPVLRDDEQPALARATAESISPPPQPVAAMFDHLLAELPASLTVQRAEAVAEAASDP